MPRLIQNEDVKSLADLTGAGGTGSQLINDTKVWDTGRNQQLSTTLAGITSGITPINLGGTNTSTQPTSGGATYYDGTKITTAATNAFVNYDGSGHTSIGGAIDTTYALTITGAVAMSTSLIMTGTTPLIQTVNNTGGTSKNLSIQTGNTLNNGSGTLSLFSGSTSGAGTSGTVLVGTGDASSTGSTGALTISTGNSTGASSGDITIKPGIAVTAQTAGTIYLTTSNFVAGNLGGKISIISYSNQTSQALILATAMTTGTQGTGAIDIFSGNASGTNKSTGNVSLHTGTPTGTGTCGTILIYTGDSTFSTTGQVSIFSGTSQTVNSGDVSMYSGNATSSASGNVNITTGNGSASSGNIVLTTGTATTTRGSISMTALNVNVTATNMLQVNNRAYAYNIASLLSNITTAAGTTTLTNASLGQIYFTGTSNQTVKLPGANTHLGQTYVLVNGSTGQIAVQATDASAIYTIPPNMCCKVVCISTPASTNAAWIYWAFPKNQASSEFSNGTVTTALALNWYNGTTQNVTLTASTACTITMSNPTAGETFQIRITAATSSSATWAGGTIKWAGGTAPTLSTTSGKVDIVSFYYDGSVYYGSYSLGY